MVGYVRADTSNQIDNGNVVDAVTLDAEFNAIEAAFASVSGHKHDGTAANGAPITVLGPVQDVTISTSAVLPKTDNTVDLGSATKEWKDLWVDGTANIDNLVADTADINAGTIDNVDIRGGTIANTRGVLMAGITPYVIVITGQSNAAGTNSGGPNPASTLVKTWDGITNAWGGSNYTGLPWSRSNPHGNSSNNNYALARAHYIADTTGREVYIVFDAVGGTSIDQWVASGTSSARYVAIKNKVQAALATLPGKTKVDEIIWAQGEEDFPDEFQTHLDNLVLLRNQFRAETWCGYDTPIYMMGPSPLHERYQWREALNYLCSKIDNRCILVPSHGLRTAYDTIGAGTPVPGSGDWTHFLGESLWEAGYHRIAAAAPSESAPSLHYARGIGPATPNDATVLATYSSIVSKDSWTALNSPTGPSATGSISWGLGCFADGNFSYTFGDNCVTDNVSNYTILAGRDLSAGPSGDYCAGFGRDHVLASSFGFASGRGHTISDDYGAAVGSFSLYTTAQVDPVRFQVGTGTSAGARNNGLTVRLSGSVEINAFSGVADPAQNEGIVFKRVNNTTLRVVMRGTDGVLRGGNITLS